MADTVRTLSSLQTILADNTAGDISPQDLRDFLVSAYQSNERRHNLEFGKTATDTPDDEFDTGSLDGKWTAVSGSSGTVDLLGTTGSTYDFTTRSGELLMQGYNGAAVELRQDYTLPDGNSIDVKIPEGTADGQVIRLRGKGGAGYGDGPAGNALVTLTVQSHPVFLREGNDVLVELPITIEEAVLGGKVEIDTLHGRELLSVPSGTQHGRVLRLRNKGVPRLGGSGRGDHRAVVSLQVPRARDLAPEQLELVEGLARMSGEEDGERTVIDRVKDLFA